MRSQRSRVSSNNKNQSIHKSERSNVSRKSRLSQLSNQFNRNRIVRQMSSGKMLQRSMSRKSAHRSHSQLKRHTTENSMIGPVTKHERNEHCKLCTQCDYWQRKIEIYQRKIDRHIEQVKTATMNTAAFNSNSFAGKQ